MSPIGSILLRNLQRLTPDAGLIWINPVADETWHTIRREVGHLALFCQDYTEFESLSATGARPEFGIFPEKIPENTTHFLLTLPRSKPRLAMQLDFVCSVMGSSDRLWLAGENQAGVKSSPRLLEDRFSSVEKLDSARHCVLFEAKNPAGERPFAVDNYAEEWQTPYRDGELLACSLPGVFSHGRTDAGTRLLLEQLQSIEITGSLLDFGCGCGLISAALARVSPDATICMTDIDALALWSSGKTIARNSVTAEIGAHNGLQGIQARFDLVVSNPPFHHGTRTNMELGMKLLNPVRNFLNPRGQFLMVGNRHLPYRKWLDGLFGSHQVLAANNQFQVLMK
jgi:16S rRNA (guanine1207-N2)-methyltransferase